MASLVAHRSPRFRSCFGRLERFLEDRRGVSAIEFAFIVPILITMYIGVVELSNELTVMRRATTVASTAADLIAQEKTTSNSGLSDAVAAATSILSPYSTTPLKMVLSSVVADQNNNPKVDWSCGSNGARAHGAGSSFTLPTGLTEANSSVIVAEVSYTFTPLLSSQFFNPGSFTIQRTFYSRPRKSLTVIKSDNGCP